MLNCKHNYTMPNHHSECEALSITDCIAYPEWNLLHAPDPDLIQTDMFMHRSWLYCVDIEPGAYCTISENNHYKVSKLLPAVCPYVCLDHWNYTTDFDAVSI
jgi:hypothetical protein